MSKTSNKNSSKEPQILDWNHFEEFLKANVPWVVYRLIFEDNKYQVSKTPPTYVLFSDLLKWREEKLIYFVYKGDKSENPYSIFLRTQFSNQDQVEYEAQFIPQKFRKDIANKISINDLLPGQKQETIAIGLKSILRRPEIIKVEKKIQNDPNKKQENEGSEIRLVNSFVFGTNIALKQRFSELYAQFERENK